jgi:uncharacterized protein YjbI with pentapeptide repeats
MIGRRRAVCLHRRMLAWSAVVWPERLPRRHAEDALPRLNAVSSCTFANSKLPGRNTHFGNSRFNGCLFHDVLRSTIVDPLFTQSADFIACKFTGRVSCVVFDGMVSPANVRRLGRATCQIVRNDFSEATLKSVDFRAVDLSENTLPRAFAATD